MSQRRHVLNFVFFALWFSLWYSLSWILFFTILPQYVPLWRLIAGEPKPILEMAIWGAITGIITYLLYLLLARLLKLKSSHLPEK